MFDQVGAAEGRHRQPLLVDEAAVDARAVAVRQHLGEHVHRVGIGVAVVGDVVRDDHRRQRPRFFERDPLFDRLHRLRGDVARHLAGAGRDAPEVARDQVGGLRHVEVAGDDHRGVGGNVEGVEEGPDVVDGGRVEVGHAADDRVLVGVGREGGLVEQLVQVAERLVVHPHPAFFLDHLALVHEGLLVDAQRAEAIGLHPQHQRQVLRRHGVPVDRRVFVRVGVGASAHRRHDRGVLLGLDVLRALEHHVFEQVREAGAPGALVLRADVVPELHVGDRRGPVRVQDHGQPVGQREALILEFRRRHRGVERHQARRAGDDGHGGHRERAAPEEGDDPRDECGHSLRSIMARGLPPRRALLRAPPGAVPSPGVDA